MKKFSNTINIYVWLLLLLSVIFTSCKKLVEIPSNPPNALSSSQVFADSTNIMSAVAGIYSYNTVGASIGFAFQDGNVVQSTGLSSDEFSTSITSNASLPQFYNNNIQSRNDIIGATWRDIYNSIYQVNACITGINSTNSTSAGLKKQLIGELEVVRAFYNFNLVNLYGGIPIVTSIDYNINATLPKASAEAVYAQIIEDLTDAETKLSADYPSSGHIRPNLYVANALLAKVYLYQGQWQKANDMASSVINSGQYILEPELNNVFLDGSQEAIWQISTNGSVSTTKDASNFIPAIPTVIPDYILSTNYLINTFEGGDQRLQKWIGVNNVNNVNYYYPYKYKNTNPSQTPIEDYMILRLGEIYLIRAEAEAHLNNLAGSRADINVIRSRAGLTTGTTAVTQQDFYNAVMHERQTELFCENGNRWYDLKRTATIDAVLGSEKKGWKSTDALFPIPYGDIQKDPKLVQNPGYN